MRDIVMPVKPSILQIQNYLDMDFTKANEQLCDAVNNGDFPLYLQNGTQVTNISYTFPSLFDPNYDPHNVRPFLANGVEYTVDDFYGLRDEIIQAKKDNLNLDNEKVTSSAKHLDPDSRHYSKEMHLADRLHKDIIVGNYGDYGATRIKTVEAWLNEFEPALKVDGAMLSRLSTIIGNKK